MVTAAVINFSMCHPEDPVSPMDFVPGEKKETNLMKMDPEKQAQYIINQMLKKKFV